MARKHIFIGLGGSGCQTVSQIKEKVYEKRFPNATASKSRLEAMNDNYRFLFIDTDSRDIEEANKRNRNSFEDGRVPFISPQTDLVTLGRANPQAIYYEATQDQETLINKRILEACSPDLAVKIPDQPLAFGAGAFRMKSRIAFAHSLSDFQSKLQAAISALNDVKTVGGEDCTIFYWVVGSTNGGTGSGIVNDVLYHVNQIHRQVVGNGDPQLVLTMYMPKVYIDGNATEDKYTLNAYAVFKEVGGFKEMSQVASQNTVMHRMAFVNDYNLIDSNRRYCPFYYLIPVDIQTDKGTTLGNTRTMYRNTAEMLYLLHAGQAGDTFRSDIDNYMNDIMERDHKDFLVPMGYVQLHKPMEQFSDYFRTRFRRDILRTWLLNEDDPENAVPDSKIEGLYHELFRELNPRVPDTIGAAILGKGRAELDDIADRNLDGVEELPNELFYENVGLDTILAGIEAESKSDEKRDQYKKKIVDGMWKQAEIWIRNKGIVFAINAVEQVRVFVADRFTREETNEANVSEEFMQKEAELLKKLKDAKDRTFIEKSPLGSNNKDIRDYHALLCEFIDSKVDDAMLKWAHDLLRDFIDEKTGEMAKLKSHLSRFKDKISEMNADAVKDYERLALKFGNTALDVTTVYLPMLKEICDGNGWKNGNFFSSLYRTIIDAQENREETPVRKNLQKFLDEGIYFSKNEKMQAEIKTGEYVVEEEVMDKNKKKTVVEDVRFFANPELSQRTPEKIVDDFITMGQICLRRAMAEGKEIQDRWLNKKVSQFFHDLTNDQKDDVRRSLNPALFFNYNSNRIGVTKREEHMVFVANDEDLAREMLGFEKGNPKHRFEQDSDENSALVLKSKFGLAFEDYRIYDAIKMVYDKASFREKYHFHHDYAQFLDAITIADLPDEVLPQHRTFAKMLLFQEFAMDLRDFFYSDEYSPEDYSSDIYIDGGGQFFEMARPEAFSIRDGKLCLCKEDRGRKFYDEIAGADFSIQFARYFELFFNHRYGETLNNIIVALLKSPIKVKPLSLSMMDFNPDVANEMSKYANTEMTAEQIFKVTYKVRRDSVLRRFNDRKRAAKTESERRLWNIFFEVVREKFDTVHKFLGK